jgi:hypothetical protein
MVVFEIDIQGVLARPTERDPIVSRHAHRPTRRFRLQAVKAKSRDIHVLGPLRYFQQLQDAHAFPDMGGTDAAGATGAMNLFKPLMLEAAYPYLKDKSSRLGVN